jgi:TrmH family RNA methyltransferase
LIRSLADKRSRDETGLFVAEGEKLVTEFLASGFTLRKLFLACGEIPLLLEGGVPEGRGGRSLLAAGDSPQAAKGDGAQTPLLREGGVPPLAGGGVVGLLSPQAADGETAAEHISPKEMSRASHLKTPTSTLALIEIPRHTFTPAALQNQLTLALDGVQNPGTLGTILRVADWFGLRNGLCAPDSADCFNPKVVQATMGALTRVAVHYGDLTETIEAVKRKIPLHAKEGWQPPSAADGVVDLLPIYGTFLEGKNIYETPLTDTGIIILGSEGRGISPDVARLVTQKLFIPPYPPGAQTSEPLNVAIAAAIICSEFRRKKLSNEKNPKLKKKCQP